MSDLAYQFVGWFGLVGLMLTGFAIFVYVERNSDGGEP